MDTGGHTVTSIRVMGNGDIQVQAGSPLQGISGIGILSFPS